MQFNSTIRASRIAAPAMAASIALALAACGGNSNNDPAKPANPPATHPPVVTPGTYVVSGKVSGLAGQGLVLRNNAGDDLAIGADGDFTFASPLASGTAYAVTVGTQPVSPTQVCTVTHGSGAIGSSNITDVSVVCASHGYTVGGTVSGLAGGGLVLQINGGDDLPVPTDGNFAFPGFIADGGAYSVTVRTAPSLPSQSCNVSHGTGTVAGAVVSDVAIACTTPMPRVVVVSNTLSGNLSSNNFLTPGWPSAVGVAQATGGGLTALTATPDGKFVYAINSDAQQVQGYAVGPAGGLTAIPAAIGSTTVSPVVIAMHPNGRVVYTSNKNADNVSAFAIDAAGGLQPMPGSPFAVGSRPEGIAVSSDGKFLYVANSDDGSVSGYALDGVTGNLTAQLPGSPYGVSSNGAWGIAIDPAGTRIYVANVNASLIDVLSIDRTTGQLAHINAIPTGPDPYVIAMHPSGKYLYVGNYNDTVDTYSIDASTGLLSFVGAASGFDTPLGFTVDKSGLYLFVANFWGMNISSLAINQATGLPSPITTTGSRGSGPRGLVVISE